MMEFISLIIQILFVAGIFITIKVTDYKGENLFIVVCANYFVATVSGFFEIDYSLPFIPHFSNIQLILAALFTGALFILNFILIFHSTRKAGIGITTVLNKTSLIIPVMVGLIVLGQTTQLPMKLIGLVIAILSFVFIFYKKGGSKVAPGDFILPVSVFIGSGLADTSMELSQRFVLEGGNSSPVFLIYLFGSAFIISILLVIKDIRRGGKFRMVALLYGIALGLFNYLASKMLLINVALVGGAVVFPVVNASVVALTAVIGVLFFKERISKRQWTGIVLAIVAVAIIASTI